MAYSGEELRAGTEAHYLDAEFYDRFYKRRKQDIDFYVRYLREVLKPREAILEMGCGTGRVTQGLSQVGFSVTGVDQMPSMLARAEKLNLPRCEWVESSIESLQLDKRFRCVIAPFNVWMHLYTPTQLKNAFDSVQRHLKRGGFFVFDILMPDIQFLTRSHGRTYRAGTLKGPGCNRYKYAERFEYDPVSQVQWVTFLFSDPKTSKLQYAIPLAHRYFFPQEMLAALRYAGFEVESLTQDFTDEPLSDEAESMVFICRKR